MGDTGETRSVCFRWICLCLFRRLWLFSLCASGVNEFRLRLFMTFAAVQVWRWNCIFIDFEKTVRAYRQQEWKNPFDIWLWHIQHLHAHRAHTHTQSNIFFGLTVSCHLKWKSNFLLVENEPKLENVLDSNGNGNNHSDSSQIYTFQSIESRILRALRWHF